MPVINLNTSIDDGSYSSMYMQNMVGMGAAGEASQDDYISEDCSQKMDKANLRAGGGDMDMPDAVADADKQSTAQGEVHSEVDSESEYTSSEDEGLRDDESEQEVDPDSDLMTPTSSGKRRRTNLDSSGSQTGIRIRQKTDASSKRQSKQVDTKGEVSDGTRDPDSKRPSAGISKPRREGRDPVEKSIVRERRAIKLFKTSTTKMSLREQLVKAHKRYGHVAPSRLMNFKSKGRIYSSLIPSAGRLEFKSKHCPICLAMKGKKPPKPKTLPTEERKLLGLWEKVGVDTAGKFRDASFQGNRYYMVFVCAKSGRKL